MAHVHIGAPSQAVRILLTHLHRTSVSDQLIVFVRFEL